MQSGIGLRRVDRELDGLTTTLSNVIRAELAEKVGIYTAAEEARFTVAAADRAVAIFFGAHGKELAASWNGLELRGWSPTVQAGELVWTERTPAGAWRLHARSQSFGGLTLVFLVGSPLADVQREQDEVQAAMLVGLPIVLLLAAGGGFWIASIGLRPISDMAQQAARIR